MFTSVSANCLPALGLTIEIFIFMISFANCQNTDPAVWNVTASDRLRAELFTNYDKDAYPISTNPLAKNSINVSFSVYYVDIDEFQAKMTVHGWAHLQWRDEKRMWNPQSFNNITNLYIEPEEVWKPNVNFFNNVRNNDNHIGEASIKLTFNGTFTWVPPVMFNAFCNLNLHLWPYDRQICKTKIGLRNWMQLQAKSFNYENVVQSNQWKIIAANSRNQSSNFYNFIEYTIELERYTSIYKKIIFTPASCIILVTLSTFWLPPQTNEKIFINGIIILIITSILIHFAQLLPIFSENTPYIGKYFNISMSCYFILLTIYAKFFRVLKKLYVSLVHFYSSCLLLLSVSTTVAVIVIYISTACHKQRLPEVIRKSLTGRLGSLLLLTQFTQQTNSKGFVDNTSKELQERVEHVDEISDSNSTNNLQEMFSESTLQLDWVLLAAAIDRICFIIFLFSFVIITLIYYL